MKIRDNVKPTKPPLPGGTYLGICVYSIAIGEQLCEYEGKSKSYNNQVKAPTKNYTAVDQMWDRHS